MSESENRYQVVKFSNGKFGVIDNVDTGFKAGSSFARYDQFVGIEDFLHYKHVNDIARKCMTDSRTTADILCKYVNARCGDREAATSFERL